MNATENNFTVSNQATILFNGFKIFTYKLCGQKKKTTEPLLLTWANFSPSMDK